MTILSVADLQALQDVSIHKDTNAVESSIEAAENEFIKKFFGDAFFSYLLENVDVSPVNTLVQLVLEGGFYEDACSPPKKFYVNGLNKAIALLVYCDLMVKQTFVTRYGATNKNNETSSRPSEDETLIQINRYRNTALSYMKDVDYLLINIDESSYDSDIQDEITAYRTENDSTVKRFFEAFQ